MPIGTPGAGPSRFPLPASRFTPHASRITHQAFTLLEILVAVGLLSVIVLGLFAMFNQTQRAFRVSMNQTDILAAGRAVTEMIPRELEQMTPSGYRFIRYPFNPYASGVSFYAAVPPSEPLFQPLPGSTLARTNVLQDCFMLLRQNQTWVGIGYFVRTPDANGRLVYPQTEPGKLGAGSLYRFAATLPVLYEGQGDPRSGLTQDPSQLFNAFRAVSSPGSVASMAVSNRICDGVVHFRFRGFDTNGVLIVPTVTNRPNADIYYAPTVPGVALLAGEIGLYAFGSNALPAAVELELGLLEQYAWERYNSIGNPTARGAYLTNNCSRVHLFRQRVSIRNVDPSAYR